MYEPLIGWGEARTITELFSFEDLTNLLSSIKIPIPLPRITDFENHGEHIKYPSKLHTKGQGKPIHYFPSTGSCWCWNCSVRFKREWEEGVKFNEDGPCSQLALNDICRSN
jgi:hypothetical protein